MTDPGAAGDGEAGPILVAVDFSADSEAALVWACGQAGLLEADLLILHVVHDPASAPGFYSQGQEKTDWLEPMTRTAERMLAAFLERMTASHPDCEPLRRARSLLIAGLPAGRIAEVAERERARLVVVGSRGRTGLPHILLGSVAERVVQTAAPPVVVVKAPPEAAPSGSESS